MLFRCTSNFEIEQDELDLSEQVYTREELHAIEEDREASILKLDGIEPISDDEDEEDLPTQSQRPLQRPRQRPRQRPKQRHSQRALGKRRKRSPSLFSIPDDDDEDLEVSLLGLPGPDLPGLDFLESDLPEPDLPPQKEDSTTQTRMSTRYQGEKRPRREDSIFITDY
jgi:hypothetical protein